MQAAIRLASLPGVPSPARWEDRLHEWVYETIEAWVDHQGSPTRMAEVLHLHAQNVRYRIVQLRRLLGDGLDDVDCRFALKVALVLRRTLAGGVVGQP